MGFWSGLGKGLLGAGGVIAAPFTGGASLATVIPAIAGGAGAVASAIGSGRAQGRMAETQANENYDRNRLLAAQAMENALQGRAGLDLAQRNYQLQAPRQRAQNAKSGDVLANVQDAQVQGPIVGTGGNVPTITGGLRPSLLSSNTRQLGQNMSRDALMQSMQGDAFQPLPPINIPQIQPPQQAGAFDKILGGIGLAGGIMGGLEPTLRQKYGQAKVPPPVDPNFDVGFG